MNILERIALLADNEGITITELERVIGASKGVLSRALNKNTDIQAKWIACIVENYPLYSSEWLLIGRGEMLKSEKKGGSFTNNEVEAHLLDRNESFNENAKTGLKPIPLVNQKVAAGFGSDDFFIQESDVKDYYVIPKFRNRNIDFMIEVSGSSMYPKYSSGDVIACAILKESAFIQWNKPHVIATKEQGILVKRLKEATDPNCLLAISDNKEYPPFEIPKDEITGIALIVGVIRLE